MRCRRRLASACSKPPRIVLKRLVHLLEVRRVQALEADQHALAAAAREQVEELLVVRGVDARLAHPADAERDQRAEELLRLREVGRDVVVDEEEQLRLALAARAISAMISSTGRRVWRGAEDRLHGAEVALEMAAAAGFDQPDRQIALAAEDASGPAAARPGGPAVLAIELLEPAVAGVVDHLAARASSASPHDHRLGVSRDFVRAERRVKSAHHDRHAAPAVFAWRSGRRAWRCRFRR